MRKINSADCVDAIIRYCNAHNVAGDIGEKQWKRVGKTVSGDTTTRTFTNKVTGHVATVEEAFGLLSVLGVKIDICFAIRKIDGEIHVSATPLSYWLKEKCCDDQSLASDVMCALGYDEVMESTWEKPGMSMKDIRKELLAAGLIDNANFTAFIKQCQS